MEPAGTYFYGQIPEYTGYNEAELSSFGSVIRTFSEKFDGTLLSLINGKSLVSFQRPENAVEFALSIVSRFHDSVKIPYCAGITGSTGDLPQDGEKLVKQLVEVCPESSVLVSGEVQDALGPDQNYKLIYIGSSLFKGTTEQTEIFALTGAGLYVPTQNELTLGERNEQSIAVLPFHNTSSDKELDYICDGIAEEVIDSLTKEKGLYVTARSSSFVFKNKEVPIREISRKLNVRYVLDGSIRKRNAEYRISYQLVDCINGYNILSDTIKTNFNSLYDSEYKISRSIIQYLNQGENEIRTEEPSNESVHPEAYSYYLQGKYHSQQWDSEAKRGILFYKKALEIQPDYSLAYAGISLCHTHLALNGYGDFRENITSAVLYAEKSIESDRSLPDGYTAKALASFWMGNWFVPDFEENITIALEKSPCNAEIRMFNGMVFLIKGELKRSLSELKLAKQLDPLSSSVNIRLGLSQYLNREYEDAHNTYTVLLNEDDHKTYNVLRLACCSIMLKQYHRALEHLNQSDDDYEYHHMKHGLYLVIYKALGDEANFHKTRNIIDQLPEQDTSTFYNKAVYNKLTGNYEESIRFLEKMLQNPLFYLMFLHYDEFWEELHDHPLFIELIASKYRGKNNQLIKIESETSEFIELKFSDLLYAEAQDNYTLIVFRDKGGVHEKILRATLANVEEQLEDQEVLRCHRSYLINAASNYSFHKADNKAKLIHPDLKHAIPVSRAKEKEVKETLNI